MCISGEKILQIHRNYKNKLRTLSQVLLKNLYWLLWKKLFASTYLYTIIMGVFFFCQNVILSSTDKSLTGITFNFLLWASVVGETKDKTQKMFYKTIHEFQKVILKSFS